MKRIVIYSGKFNNGHVTGLMGWYQTFEYLGYYVELALPMDYLTYFSSEYKIINNKNINFCNFDIVFIFNLSLHDQFIITEAKRHNSNIKILFLHHEPWRGFKLEKERLTLSFSMGIKILSKKIIAKRVIKNSDCIILPSKNSYEIYKKNESKYNSRYEYTNLIIVDSEHGDLRINKRYFSFIATATRDKGIDIFFEFVKYCFSKAYDITFSITTKTDLTQYIDKDIEEIIKNGYLLLKHGKPLSETEMNEAYDNSLCSWLVYLSSSQSGVLPKCLLWGSPVVASKTGVFLEQIDGKNGILIEKVDDFEEIYCAYKKIKDNKTAYINNARKTYERFYSIESNAKTVERIINAL